MPEIQFRIVGGRKHTLLAPNVVKIGQLQDIISEATGKKDLFLVLRGQHLHDQKEDILLSDGDTILGMPKRQAPPDYASQFSDGDGYTEEDIRFKLPPNASRGVRALARFLQNRLRLPDILLVWLFAVKLKHWVMLLVWVVLSPVAAKYDLGPVYIVATLFALMLYNLGKREHGETSAYSWFNEGFRQLPGQLNADALDQQIRRGGHM